MRRQQRKGEDAQPVEDVEALAVIPAQAGIQARGGIGRLDPRLRGDDRPPSASTKAA